MPKVKCTAFNVFIEEVFKPQQEALGKTNLKAKDLKDEAYEIYRNLSAYDKNHYVNLAKTRNNEKKLVTVAQTVQSRAEVEQQKSLEWTKAINVYLDKCTSVEDLKKNYFYIAGVQYALKTEEGEFLPLELGVVQWSMEAGISDSFHTFMKPGKIPLGYSYRVRFHAKETHQIEEESFIDFPNNYKVIFQQLRSFITSQDTIQPVYCMKQDIPQVKGCLEWLNKMSWMGNEILVLPIEELVIQFFSVVNQSSFPLSITSFLTSVRFEHLKKTRCHLHNDLPTRNCAIGHAKVLSYSISDVLSEMFNFEITHQHIPECQEGNYKVWPSRQLEKNFAQGMSFNEEEQDEDGDDDDDFSDDGNDKETENTFMKVNDFKSEFEELNRKNPKINRKSISGRDINKNSDKNKYNNDADELTASISNDNKMNNNQNEGDRRWGPSVGDRGKGRGTFGSYNKGDIGGSNSHTEYDTFNYDVNKNNNKSRHTMYDNFNYDVNNNNNINNSTMYDNFNYDVNKNNNTGFTRGVRGRRGFGGMVDRRVDRHGKAFNTGHGRGGVGYRGGHNNNKL